MPLTGKILQTISNLLPGGYDWIGFVEASERRGFRDSLEEEALLFLSSNNIVSSP
jgi:hypothetical protein